MRDITKFSEGMAQIFANYGDDEDVQRLHLEWAIDHWAAIEMHRYAPVFDKCFKAMSDPVIYNDLDMEAQIVEWPGSQAIAHQDQNRNYVYVRKPPVDEESKAMEAINQMMGNSSGEFHIYRYWIVPQDDEERESNWQEWADYPPDKWGPERPTLEHLIAKAGTTYNDCRDRAWIASIGTGYGAEHGMIYNYADFKSALFNLGCLSTELT